MNLDFPEERKLLRTTAHGYLEDRGPLRLARSILESQAPMSGAPREGAAEPGRLGAAAIPEAYGGAGFGHAEPAPIAEELGRTLAPSPFAASTAASTAAATEAEAIADAGNDEQRRRPLPGFAATRGNRG